MTLTLFDTHAHLNVDTFDDSVDEVVAAGQSSRFGRHQRDGY